MAGGQARGMGKGDTGRKKGEMGRAEEEKKSDWLEW